MEDIVEAISVGVVGIVGELCPERLAVNHDTHPLACFPFDIDEFDLKAAWQSLAFRQGGVEAQRFSAFRNPALLDLGEIRNGDVGEREVELARDIGDVPQ